MLCRKAENGSFEPTWTDAAMQKKIAPSQFLRTGYKAGMFLRTAYLFLVALMCAVGLTYGLYSGGAAAFTDDGPFFCDELRSSGGDDTAVVGFAFALFGLPLLVRLLQFFKAVSKIEAGVYYFTAFTAIIFLFLASLDCAQIFYTAFRVPDPHLAVALVSLPASFLLLVRMRTIS